MIKRTLVIGVTVIILISCNSIGKKPETIIENQSIVQVVGAMKNVMWKGELAGTINLDTINDKNGLYGLGPVEYLTGELLIIDGKSYVSAVITDSTMAVKETYQVKAPFFVFANQTEWDVENLSSDIKTIKELEEFIDKKTLDFKRPFVFKLKGQVNNAEIHIQNLPKGTKVSSPEEAHQGQTNYSLENSDVEIVGFFSTEHKGVFTHHDSNVHMHLITTDRKKMGHLDKVLFGSGTVRLYLPKK
ncbi:MAG TPA: alpha-acetolactate decarboxylase [Flavobacteriales bacterium]|nr:alpha-acetolactate decarboxylase [Flavobacteriales bacterium]HIN40166.1 alpha-acetolactate decarboxylase [Flavobacteriales bacterium]